MRVLIRCDASSLIGSGHVMRCRNLGRALQQRGVEVLFVCRQAPGDLINLLSQEFLLLRLPPRIESASWCEGMEGRDIYTAWLGCSVDQDVNDCVNAISTLDIDQIDWLVVDHYSLDQSWESQICEKLSELFGKQPRLFVIDDLADRPHQADVLLDANRLKFSAYEDYQGLLPSSCSLLLGPAYAPMDPLYGQLHPLTPPRVRLRRVLVFFGGVDKDNYTYLALMALSHHDFAELDVDVVLSTAAPNYSAVAKLVKNLPQVQIHSDLTSLAGLILRADLAIGAAGSVSWERSALALPALVAVAAENQLQGAQALVEAGAAKLIDPSLTASLQKQIDTAIRNYLKTPEHLQKSSECASLLGDGRGLDRLLTLFLGPTEKLRLRPANPADVHIYYSWANEPEVRRQSLDTSPIPFEHHQVWFNSRLSSPNALLRILEDERGLPLGQIRFERSANSLAKAVISFSLDIAARGHGLASKLLNLGIAELHNQWGNTMEPYAEVRPTNYASAKVFLSNGFIESCPRHQGVRCFSIPNNSIR